LVQVHIYILTTTFAVLSGQVTFGAMSLQIT